MTRFVLASLLLLTLPAFAESPDAGGPWAGAIELPGVELAIAVDLEAGSGGWSGSIDIPAQGLRDYQLSQVEVVARRVHFAMDGIPGQPTFEGELSADGSAITGTFRQGPQSFPFSLRRPAETTDDAAPPLPPGVPGEGVVGEWLGTLDVGALDLRIVLRVEGGEDGALAATLLSVDQDAELEVETLTVEDDVLRFAVAGIDATFSGVLADDGSAIDGSWTQGGRTLPLVLRRLAEPFALERPQTPRPPFPYESREVTFPNESAGIELAGTLLVPHGEGPFPTVLFVTGSGAQDRDESLMGHKPFLVLADHLARRGIASLRHDDRGVGESTGDFSTATVADLASDVEAGVAFLAAQPEIAAPDAIGILGHSEGGLHAPRIASANGEVDFLVLLAPPGEPLIALLMRQARWALEQGGADADLIDRALAAQEEDLDLLRDASLSTEEVTATLRARAASRRDLFSETELAILGLDAAAVERGILAGTTPWFRSLLREDPAVHLGKIRIPVLALFGEKDVQVDAAVNSLRVESALAAAGNEDFAVHVLVGLNHLFQTADTGALTEYATIEETFAPEALERIADWIAQRFAGERRGAPETAAPGGEGGLSEARAPGGGANSSSVSTSSDEF